MNATWSAQNRGLIDWRMMRSTLRAFLARLPKLGLEPPEDRRSLTAGTANPNCNLVQHPAQRAAAVLGIVLLGCVIGMMSLVEATSMSRRTRMAPRCIGPENFRGAIY